MTGRLVRGTLAAATVIAAMWSARAADDASVPGKLVEERPTLVCLGAYEFGAPVPRYGPRHAR